MTSSLLPLENVMDEIASQAAGHSPSGSVTSMESSASKSLNLDPAHHHYPKPQINFVRAAPWRIQSKHYKDIQIRTFFSVFRARMIHINSNSEVSVHTDWSQV